MAERSRQLRRNAGPFSGGSSPPSKSMAFKGLTLLARELQGTDYDFSSGTPFFRDKFLPGYRGSARCIPVT